MFRLVGWFKRPAESRSLVTLQTFFSLISKFPSGKGHADINPFHFISHVISHLSCSSSDVKIGKNHETPSSGPAPSANIKAFSEIMTFHIIKNDPWSWNFRSRTWRNLNKPRFSEWKRCITLLISHLVRFLGSILASSHPRKCYTWTFKSKFNCSTPKKMSFPPYPYHKNSHSLCVRQLEIICAFQKLNNRGKKKKAIT